MERIKELARQLAERFGTADPFALCAALDITVLPVGLPPGVRGFYGCVHGARILYLNGALEENERRTVCAHELGHALLHEGHNALFLRERTDFVMERYEREADLFAGYLRAGGGVHRAARPYRRILHDPLGNQKRGASGAPFLITPPLPARG